MNRIGDHAFYIKFITERVTMLKEKRALAFGYNGKNSEGLANSWQGLRYYILSGINKLRPY